MTLLELTSLLIVLAGLFGAVNYFTLKLPQAIGILVVTLGASLLLLGLDALAPQLGIAGQAAEAARGMEFSDALMEGMLGLLLFAGALHVSIADLKAQAPVVFLMATLGVAISTGIVGAGMWLATGMPLLVALVFGALISPTDPVAVLGVLRGAGIRPSLETTIAGESLFNDGVGYVVYLLLVGLAFPGGGEETESAGEAALLFLREAAGGGALGCLLGWAAFQLMKRIDDYSLEVLLTLGLAFGGYSLARLLHVSAPIMAVCAGLLVGHIGMRDGMSERTRDYVDAFWRLIDEILNAVLFLMIGFEVFAIAFSLGTAATMALAVGLALVARLLAVVVPLTLLRPFRRFERDMVPMMTWGGLKGGISIALALSLPSGEWTPVILSATYGVVVFSIIVQGLTIGRLAAKISRGDR